MTEHLERAIELIREVKDHPITGSDQQHLLDRAILLVTHELALRESDQYTKVRLLLQEFSDKMRKLGPRASYHEKKKVSLQFMEPFLEAGAYDLFSCMQAYSTKDDFKARCHVVTRICWIAKTYYDLRLMMPYD
jgi:hypothetical protein